MATVDLGYNYFGDDPEKEPTFLDSGGYGWNDPYYGGDLVGWDQIDQSDIDLDPWQFAHDTGLYPTDEFGNQVPYDQLTDWYYNNPDAQYYIQDYWNGGNGDVSQPPPPATGGDGAAPPPSAGSQPSNIFGTAYAPGEGFPSITTAEPLQMSEQDRMLAAAYGDLLDQGYRDSQNRYEDWEGFARDQAWNGPGGYGRILTGEGGFSPTEQADILQRDMLLGGMAGDADYNANYMTPEEIAAIQGNPYAARDMAQGKLAYLDQWLREGDAAQRGAVSALDTELRATVDPAKLGLSDEYNANFQFGPEDAADYAQQAARMIGIRGQSERDALARAAASAGNVNPMAVAARQSRNKIQSDISAGDAYSDALLKGKGLQLDVAGQREAARLGTERDISGRQRQNVSETRQTQLDTERGISNAWNDYGRYNTNLMVDTTGQAEAAASNRAGSLATNRQNVNQQNINARFGQAGTASSALSSRYGQIYGQKKAEEAEGRGFLTGQQDRAQAGGQNAAGNRLNLYGQRMNAQGNATSRAIQAKNLPGMFDKAAGFFGGLFGG